MFETVVILMMIVAILLILVILVQNPKGGGLSSEFGGGATSQMFGVQKTGDILEKLTWGFYAFLVVGGLLSGIFMRADMTTQTSGDLDVERSTSAPVPTLPAAPAQQGTPFETAPATTPAE
jgi:preprotein translocase subunit SecG